MDAFYERSARRKLYAFGMKDRAPFGVAGVWENWRNPKGEWERTFAIITVDANELVGQVSRSDAGNHSKGRPPTVAR